MSRTLPNLFPWAVSPVICNGPMIGAACPALATEVSKAGGIGFLASTVDLSRDSLNLDKLDADLTECRERLGDVVTREIPVGCSFITGHPSITNFTETALPIVKKHRPAAVWLFAPEESVKPHMSIIHALKSLDYPPKVFVQVGNVKAAREAIEDLADVLVLQGTDAGGHQFRRGQSVLTLLPSVKKMIEEEFPIREIAIVAAGGIVNGDGVAAAMTLGASGVVMGTRFTVADESIYAEHKKQLVLDTRDGGIQTLKSPFNDQINKNPLWGPLYDGRAIIGPIHEKFLSGSSIEECQKSLREDYSPEEGAKLIGTWAGTGVGLVTKAQPAGEIVKEVREEAKEAILRVAKSFP